MTLNIFILISLFSTAIAVSDVINIISPALFPESIDIDKQTNMLIAGSFAQGVLFSVSFEGVVSPFINDTEVSGAGRGILGVQVDSANRVIWTCIQSLDYAINFEAFSGIAAYDLDKKQRRFLSQLNGVDPAGDPRGVYCNDIVQTTDGSNAFLTDSYGDRIYKVSSSGVVTLESADPLLAKNDQEKLIGISGIEINSEDELIISHQSNKALLKVLSRHKSSHPNHWAPTYRR
jgi:hypothetical protein